MVTHGRGIEGETGEWNGKPVLFTLHRNMVYPALLPLICTPRLPVVNWTEAPADLNGLVRFVEKWNTVSARVQSHFNWPLQEGNYAQAHYFCVADSILVRAGESKDVSTLESRVRFLQFRLSSSYPFSWRAPERCNFGPPPNGRNHRLNLSCSRLHLEP
jgi:hypothetical protein